MASEKPPGHLAAGRLRTHAACLALVALLLALSACMLPGCQSDATPGADNQFKETPREKTNGEIVRRADGRPTSVDLSSLKASFQSAIADCADPSSVAVTFRAVGDLSGGFELNGENSMIAASMIKMVVLSDLLEKVKDGRLGLDDVLAVQEDDVVGGAGTGIVAGQELSIRELAGLMISESDNTAGNALISLVGIDDVNAHARRMGYGQTQLNRKLMSTDFEQDNLVSSNDLADIFEAIAEGTLGSAEMSAMAGEFLLAQTDDLGLLQGVSADFWLGHKTGSLDEVRNDGGIFYDASGEPAFVLVVLTNDVGAGNANALMGELAALACAEMSGL